MRRRAKDGGKAVLGAGASSDPVDAQTTSGYAENARAASQRALRVIGWLGLVLYPAFGVLDLIRFPDLYPTLFLIRALVVPVIAMVLASTYATFSVRYAHLLGTILFQSLGLGITAMVLVTGGESSSYWAGLTLVMVGQALAMSWSVRATAVNVIGICVFYAAAVLVFDRGYADYDWRRFIEHNFFLLGNAMLVIVWSFISNRLYLTSYLQARDIEQERDKSDSLLRNIFPRALITELKESGRITPKAHPSATVVFTDFVNFAQITEKMDPEDVALELDRAFEFFDLSCAKYRLEKIKTIGDSFMCAAGVPDAVPSHALRSCLMALEIRSFVNMMNNVRRAVGEELWEIRIGIHSGPVAAGVVGTTKYGYDIWGDTVNLAARMESYGEAGEINVSRATLDSVEKVFVTEYRGEIDVKQRGKVAMFFVHRIRPEFSEDANGRIPTAKLLSISSIHVGSDD